MWRLAIALLLALAGPALAQTATVRSGEHDGFSRLVVLLTGLEGWSLTRTPDGYAFAAKGAAPRYDVADVFRLIPRTRLTAIWAEEGRLRMTLGCACHAEAFEQRPGVVVIDLRDGPPPAGSAWERRADGSAAPPLAGTARPPAIRPRPRPAALVRAPAPAREYARIWWKEPLKAQAAGVLAPPLENRTGPGPSWSSELMAELARAGTRGDIDLSLDGAPARVVPSAAGGHIRIGGGAIDGDTRPDLTPDGQACIPDLALALADWGDPRPVAQAIGPLTAQVMGEFDRPDPDALDRAQRYLLHLGFGAEARQLAPLFPDPPPDAALRDSLARLLDGDPDPGGAFAGMAGCDTAAALWSMLADPAPAPAPPAILRSFSALPLHLRRQLAPALADRFLAAGDAAAARAVRDAVLRAPGDPGDAIRLMERHIDHPEGPPAAALANLQAAPGETGVRAVIESLQAETARGVPAADPLVTAAEALLMEHRGAEAEPALRAALAGAHALRGESGRAFDLAAGHPALEAEVWAQMAAHGPDGDLLLRAIVAPKALPQITAPDTDRAVARRLIALGFPEAALPWLSPARRGTETALPEDRLIEAEALLALGDARNALRLIAGEAGAADLRSAALRALGDPTALDLLEGDAARALAREIGQWERVAATDLAPWATAAAARNPVADPPGTPLARARALVDDSAAARAAIGALLATTPVGN